MNDRRALTSLLEIMNRPTAGPHEPPHVAAYAWLSRAVKDYLDGAKRPADLDQLAADLSVCEVAILQVSGR